MDMTHITALVTITSTPFLNSILTPPSSFLTLFSLLLSSSYFLFLPLPSSSFPFLHHSFPLISPFLPLPSPSFIIPSLLSPPSFNLPSLFSPLFSTFAHSSIPLPSSFPPYSLTFPSPPSHFFPPPSFPSLASLRTRGWVGVGNPVILVLSNYFPSGITLFLYRPGTL